MYNRYIGNTGRVVRVEETIDAKHHPQQHHSEPKPHHETPHHEEREGHTEPPRHAETKKSSFLSGLGSLGSLGGLSGLGGGLLKSIDSVLPFGLETADLILLALFLFLYIESGDEEFLIILGFLAYSFFKDSREKE